MSATGTTEDVAEPSGISISDIPIDDELQENTEGLVFQTDGETRVEIGESAGNAIFVEGEVFVALSMEGEAEVDQMEAMMQGINPESDEVVDVNEEDGTLTVEVDEASVFVSNEDGEVGGGVLQEDGADLQDALDLFAERHL